MARRRRKGSSGTRDGATDRSEAPVAEVVDAEAHDADDAEAADAAGADASGADVDATDAVASEASGTESADDDGGEVVADAAANRAAEHEAVDDEAGETETVESETVESEVAESEVVGSAARHDDALDKTVQGATAPSVGTLLREAREGRDLGVIDLARTLNLQPRVIEALEEDDDAHLPPPAFVRGYIRSYARLMGLDTEPLLKNYDARTGGVVVGVRPSPRIEYAGDAVGMVHRRPGMVMALATIALVAAVVAAFVLLWPDALSDGDEASAAAPVEEAPAARSSRNDGRTLPPEIRPVLGDGPPIAARRSATASARESETGSVTASVTAAPPVGAERADASSGLQPGADVADATGVDTGTADTVITDDSSADAEPLRSRTADGMGIRVFAGGEDHLLFTFTEDCWVEVRDADDATIYADLNSAGERVDLFGRAPFRIRLGYAPAVELSYNGSRVALRPHTRNDVASLVLGR